MNTETLEYPPVTFAPAPALPAPVSIRQTVLDQFHATEPGLVALAAKYQRVAFDTGTTKGMDAAKAARLDLRNNGRFLIERAEKRIKGEVNELKRDMADEVARLVAIVQPVEDHVDAQIKAREVVLAAEKAERDRIEAERVAAHAAVIAGIYLYPNKARGATAEKLAAGIAFVESQVYGPELEEYQEAALAAQREAIDALRAMHTAAVKAEQDAADREAQRIENARVAAELAADRKRLADEAAAVKAQALALQRKLDAQAKKEADELAAQRAESDRLEALAEAKRQKLVPPCPALSDKAVADANANAFIDSLVPAAPLVATPEGDKGPPEVIAFTHRAEPGFGTDYRPDYRPIQSLFIDLRDIEALLGFALSPQFVTEALGIKPAATDDTDPLFNPCQWGAILTALLAHITKVKENCL